MGRKQQKLSDEELDLIVNLWQTTCSI